MSNPVRPTWADVMRAVFGDCLVHEHREVGSCVYCADCDRRLYQGLMIPLADRVMMRAEMGQPDE